MYPLSNKNYKSDTIFVFLEKYFSKFRNNVVGNETYFNTPFGRKKMIYADWIASGRLYQPIEDRIANDIGPFVGNTHTETTETGTLMTKAYQFSHKKIKQHFNSHGYKSLKINTGRLKKFRFFEIPI